MHFMAPVNINNNGTPSVVKSATSELLFSPDISNTNPPVYVSSKLINLTKMAPRNLINGNTLMQVSSPRQQLPMSKPTNGNHKLSHILNVTMSTQDSKSMKDHSSNGVCKGYVNVISDMPATLKSASSFSCQTKCITTNSSLSSCKLNHAPADKYEMQNTSSKHHVLSKSSVEQDYQHCLSVYNQNILRLEHLQNQIKQFSEKSAQFIAHTALAKVKQIDTSTSSQSHRLSDQVWSVLDTCAKELDSDETESSSDEETPLIASADVETFDSCKKLSGEKSWLCSRAVHHAQWHWILSEIQHAEFALKNLKTLIAEAKRYRCHHKEPFESGHCARTLPLPNDSKQDVYRLENNSTVAELLAASTEGSGVVDGSIRCNCRAPETGSCILCLGRIHRTRPLRSWSQLKYTEMDRVKRAMLFDSSIHHKLSTQSDIPLSLTMEQRLRHVQHSDPPHWSTPRHVTISIPQAPTFVSLPTSPCSPLRPPPSPASSVRSERPPNGDSSNIAVETDRERWMWDDLADGSEQLSNSSEIPPKRRKLTLSEEDSSGGGIESRRTSQEALSEACPSPGLPSTRLTRLPCVDLELPSWRVLPSTLQSNLLPSPLPFPIVSTTFKEKQCLRLHVPFAHQHSSAQPLPVPLRIETLPAVDLREDTSDQAYQLRHESEESEERARVCGVFPGTSATHSRSQRRSHASIDGPAYEYEVSSQPGYQPRYFPLTQREMSSITEEQETDDIEWKNACEALVSCPDPTTG